MLSILIVDDNDAMRRLIQLVVAPVAHTIRACADGAAALAAVREGQPDWVLMDVEMPEVDGITALGSIKAACPAVRVLIVTQYDDDRLRAAARRAGADGYVLKEDLTDIPRLLVAIP
jgi:CheY-like chemotaxis protein